MKKTKGYCKNNSSYQATYQWGNTLVPVIISLAISAIATIAFLNQGANLSQKNKILMAQYEIVNLVQQWNILKSTTSNITASDLPLGVTNNTQFALRPNLVLGTLPLGHSLFLTFNSGSPNYVSLRYIFSSSNSDREACSKLASMFSSDMEGISNQIDTKLTLLTNSNPGCTGPTFVGIILVIRLD